MRYSFGDYMLDTQRRELHHAGVPITLRRKVFQVLVYLLRIAIGSFPSKSFLEHLWPGQFVGEAALTSCIQALRRALGERGRTARVLRTLHGQGYRFVGAVEEREHLPADEAPHVLPVRRGEKVTRQTEGPLPAMSSSLADLRNPPWLTREGFFRHDPDPGGFLPLPPGEGGGEGAYAIPPSIPHHHPLPEGEGTTYRLQSCPPWEVLDGEHKQVTVLCGALAEAPTLAARLGPEAMHYLMHDVLALAQDTVQRYEGTLIQVSGEGFLALFGAPVAQEDHARRAVLAALELRQRLRVPDAIRGQPHGVEVRLGLHTGPVVVGPLAYEPQRLYTAAGDTLYLATRLQQQAAPDTCLVGAATYALVQDEVQGEVCEALCLDGSSAPGPVYAIHGLLRRRGGVPRRGARPLSSFVGRTQEMALLHARLAQAVGGQGQVIGIAGEPGMGKSRLLGEFVHSLRGRPITCCEGHCLAYGSATSYLPVRDMLRQLWGLADAAPATAITATVRQRLREAGVASEDEALVLLQLLDVPVDPAPLVALDPQMRKARAFTLLCEVFRHASQRQPLMLAVENLHWIDPTSEAWLASLVERLGDVPVLLLVTYRPGYQPPWTRHSAATQMALPRLSPRDSLTALRSMPQAAQLPGPVQEAIVATAAGNPFFVEELTWTAVEHGDPAGPLPLPDTIEAVLAARIDRLPQEDKCLLQTAAVIGTEVPVPLLQRLVGLPEDALHRGLAYLQGREFLHETHRFPEHAYTFKHALTREVAYGSLLHERRRVLHVKIVEALEALYPDRLSEYAERMAHHALRGEVWAKAVTYSRQVGEKAWMRSAFREAVASCEHALQALAHLPEHDDTRGLAIDIRLALAASLSPLGEYGRCLALWGEAEALARALDDRTRLGRVLAEMGGTHRITGDHDGAIAAGRQALELATALGDGASQALASYSLGKAYYAIGDFGRAAELQRWNVEATERESGTSSLGLRSRYRARLARTLGELGAFAEGRRHGEEALRLAMLEGRVYTLTIVHGCLGDLYLAQGDLEHAIRVYDRCLALCRASGNRTWLRVITQGLGYSYALQGRLAEGRALMEEAISEGIRTAGLAHHSHRVAQLSAVCRLAGCGEEAGQHARQALDLARQHKERANEAHALFQLGAVHAHASPPDVPQAEARYREALMRAEALGMRPLQAHCHRGLGTLYSKDGSPEHARAELSTAIELYRAMEMTFWLSQAEADLAEVEGH